MGLSKQWHARQVSDPFVRQRGDYRARSAFKLLEICEKFKLLRGTRLVADLGAFPGGWSQILSEKLVKNKSFVAEKKRVLAMDLQEMQPIPGVACMRVDLEQQKQVDEAVSEFFSQQSQTYFNAVVSDMAPATIGNASSDSARSMALLELAIQFSIKHLPSPASSTRLADLENAFFIGKLFQGEPLDDVKALVQEHFARHHFYKPKSSRSESREVFLVCVNRLID